MGKRIGVQKAIHAFAAHTPFSRRLWSIVYSFTLSIEGVGWLLGLTKVFSPIPSSLSFFSAIDHGLLNLLAAALMASDASAIHQQSLLFQISRGLKFGYPLSLHSIVLFGINHLRFLSRVTSYLDHYPIYYCNYLVK